MCLRLFLDTVQYMIQPWLFMMGPYLEMHSVRLRFLWMMGSAQFFWWVIQPDQDRLCMRCFGAVKKVYFECILGLV
jgi:hypothetical protein